MSRQTATTLTRSFILLKSAKSKSIVSISPFSSWISILSSYCLAGERSIQPSYAQVGQWTIQDSKLCNQSRKRNRSINFHGVLVTTLELVSQFLGLTHKPFCLNKFVIVYKKKTHTRTRSFLYLQDAQSMETYSPTPSSKIIFQSLSSQKQRNRYTFAYSC